MIPQALSTAPQEAFPSSMQSVPGRKLNESKTACSFLLFVYNTAIRRSDALNMVGISGGLQYKRQAQIHTCVCGLLFCNRFHTQMNPCTHTQKTVEAEEPVCACCLLVCEGKSRRGSVLSIVSRQPLKQAGKHKMWRLWSRETLPLQLSASKASIFMPGRSDYRLLLNCASNKTLDFFFVFAVDLNSLCHSAVIYINTNPGGIMHVLYGANAGPKCIIL